LTPVESDKELPPVGSLSSQQQRGVSCIWCATPLRNGTAIDLGTQTLTVDGCTVRWFPRSCPYPCQKGQP
jgi:hypothetical protein